MEELTETKEDIVNEKSCYCEKD